MHLGKRFGFVASTDHHAGYPGSYGDGRVAVLASEKTREAIWEALVARRTYAVTGDRIRCAFRVNDACMGSEVKAGGTRRIRLSVTACDAIDKVLVYRNCEPWQVFCGECLSTGAKAKRYKVRVEAGWGLSAEPCVWEGNARVQGGDLLAVEPCFRGRNVLAPSRDKSEDDAINALENRVLEYGPGGVAWRCTSFENPSTLHPMTAAVILEIEGDDSTSLQVRLNGASLSVSLGELAEGSRGMHTRPYGSEAFLIHRAIPETEYRFCREWTDTSGTNPWDAYDLEIRQVNGQCAWISPVFIQE
jgi:hypothetical protein